MEIKISTKEKFTVITPITPQITDTNAEEVSISCLNCLNGEIKSVVLNLQSVTAIDNEAAKTIANLQQQFYHCG